MVQLLWIPIIIRPISSIKKSDSLIQKIFIRLLRVAHVEDFLFLTCLIYTSRAIKLIEVAFYHIPRCTQADGIPIYDSICNANRGQSFQLKLFLFHSPLPLFEHITRRIHTIPVLRLCVSGAFFFLSSYMLFVPP